MAFAAHGARPTGVGLIDAELRRLAAGLDAERHERQLLEARLVVLERRAQSPAGNARASEEYHGGEGDGSESEEPDEEFVGIVERARESAATAAEVDLGQTFALKGSVWDASIFVGCRLFGPARSFAIVMLTVAAMCTQLYFCHVVSTYMLDDPLSESMLHSLLQFRTSIAHDIRYADHTKQRSLIAAICSGEHQLQIPFAGKQVSAFEDLKSMGEGGECLCMFALFCWFMTVVREFDSISHCAGALWRLVGGRTCIKRADADGCVELVSVSRKRALGLFVFVFVPRIAIAFALLYTGALFLVVTTNVSDMLLNAITLGFILDIDDLMFSILAPRRAKHVVTHTKPLPLPERSSGIVAALRGPMAKLLAICALLCIARLHLRRVHERVNQAMDLLCSGELDFVVAMNPVTGLVQVGVTPVPDRDRHQDAVLTPAQLAVLQVAAPRLREGVPGWEIDPVYVETARSSVRTAQIEVGVEDIRARIVELIDGGSLADAGQPVNMRHDYELSNHTPDDGVLRYLLLMADDGAWDLRSLCRDTHPVSTWEKAILRRHGMDNCSEGTTLCGQLNASGVRGLCPITCGCQSEHAPAAGFFAGRWFGCPASCGLSRSGLAMPHPSASSTCLDAAPEAFATDPYITRYIEGAIQFLTTSVKTLHEVSAALRYDMLPTGVLPKSVRALLAHVVSGNFTKDILQGRWGFGPGMLHPRGLEGCAFWTSWETASMLGLDLCDVGSFRSLRGICPVACGCAVGGSQPECPLSCG